MLIYSDPTSELHVNRLAGVEAPERFPAAIAGVEAAEQAGVPVEWRSCEPAPDESLNSVHSAAYLEHIEGLSRSGGGHLSLDTSVNEHSWDVALLASGAACSAVESALSGTSAFSISRPPGHHAGSDYGMGFCLLNHAAVATAHARSLGTSRVAILDWDVHHGNGTQDIFYDDRNVLYLSTHQSPFYPGTGALREMGEDSGEGFTVNVPLPAGSGEDYYSAVLGEIFLPILREFKPEIIIVSAGFDSHKDDLLGGMALTTESFGRFAAWLAAFARDIDAPPLALILEGGYNLDALTASVSSTIAGIEEEVQPPEWKYSGNVAPVERTREALLPFWKSLG